MAWGSKGNSDGMSGSAIWDQTHENDQRTHTQRLRRDLEYYCAANHLNFPLVSFQFTMSISCSLVSLLIFSSLALAISLVTNASHRVSSFSFFRDFPTAARAVGYPPAASVHLAVSSLFMSSLAAADPGLRDMLVLVSPPLEAEALPYREQARTQTRRTWREGRRLLTMVYDEGRVKKRREQQPRGAKKFKGL